MRCLVQLLPPPARVAGGTGACVALLPGWAGDGVGRGTGTRGCVGRSSLTADMAGVPGPCEQVTLPLSLQQLKEK